MSMPNIPDICPEIDLCKEDVVNLLLASVALEEIGLAHIINAEGEKLQYVLNNDKGCKGDCKGTRIDEILEVNKSIQTTLRDVIKKEMLLEFKFENILELIDKDKTGK